MNHDITTIKARLDLLEIFRRDGYEPRRMGLSQFVNCPFHEEKSPSCKVEEKRFKCFGCGAGGDVFDYWEKSRSVSRSDAIDQLANLAGVSAGSYQQPLHKPATAAPGAEKTIPPLTPAQLGDWQACVQALRDKPREISRIAAWRGIGEDVIHWALDRGIIGLRKWQREWREAFLVEMPADPTGPLIPVTTHIRLGPHTRGNDKDKASWRFDPVDRGAWPLVFGDLSAARYLFLVEGQWDALAMIHLMRWHISWPAGTALIAMRGATSFRKFLSHYVIPPTATVFAFADADAAGAEWFQPEGLVHRISTKVRRVYAFLPARGGTDLNDLIKNGFTRDAMRAILASKLSNPRMRKPSGPTFLAWCRARSGAPDPIGRAARMVCADTARPKGRQRQTVWERHWRKLGIPPDLTADLDTAWFTYKSECS
jgi:hypothetical protein